MGRLGLAYGKADQRSAAQQWERWCAARRGQSCARTGWSVNVPGRVTSGFFAARQAFAFPLQSGPQVVQAGHAQQVKLD